MALRALIFDVDGTLAETDETHRAAFNAAFAEAGLDWYWSVALYRELLQVTGGKERMRRYAEIYGLSTTELPDSRIADLHARKNVLYGALTQQGACPLRPGVDRLVRGAFDEGLRLAICTTTSRANVEALISTAWGATGRDLFAVIVAGEDVRAKKPSPDAYLRVLDALALAPEACLAFEDSRSGLLAAQAAKLRTIVTPSLYTSDETFEGAAEILPDLDAFDLPAFEAAAAPH
jgi:beta-phosphoglucomutase-like phosphatase (HAD superfamily)